MARRSDHSREELKELILDTAWNIVGESGFEGLTARQLAKEIGYAPGTIYNLFSSMDDLYLQVSGRTLDMLYETLSAATDMKMMAAAYMDFARAYRPYWLMLFSHSLPEGQQIPQRHQEKIDRLFLPLEKLLAPLFNEQQDKERTMAARVLWSSVHGLCLLQEAGKIGLIDEQAAPETMAAYLIDTFVAGIENG